MSTITTKHGTEEGSIVMQVKGGKPVIVGRNASATKPARFVVLLLKKQGAPALVPVQDGQVACS